MPKDYDIIKQLIDLWAMYEDESESVSILNFAGWITSKLKTEPELDRRLRRKIPGEELMDTEYSAYIQDLDDKAQFQEYIVRLARFYDFYTRKFFSELSINTRLDYIFLFTILRVDSIRKTDLINIHLVEYSTGMDIIKRLIQNGQIEEKHHMNDKRSRLLVLTGKGRKTLEEASKKMDLEREMFLAGINANKWKKTLPVLKEISDFHNSIYNHHGDKPYQELLNLMDSLKHFRK